MFSKKLKKKELISLIHNYKEENKILLETIDELKNMTFEPKEIIVYREIEELTKKEKRQQNKIEYFKKRFQITQNIIYKNELNRY